MCELQAIIEFSVELHKFINIDLFQRGYYQIRVGLKIASKLTNKIEINFANLSSQSQDQSSSSSSSSPSSPDDPSLPSGSLPNGSSNIVFPCCVVNGSAVSKTFQILYKNEEVQLNDVVSFKVHVIVDPNECIHQIRKAQFILDIELWFTDQQFGPDHHNSIECVSSRQLILHVDILRGLNYNLPILFDYFHLSALTLSIHGSLITLCQPYLTNRGFQKGDKKFGQSNVMTTPFSNCTFSYDMILFGGSAQSIKNGGSINDQHSAAIIQMRLRRAHITHWQLISILIIAINNLKRKLEEFINLLPPWEQIKCSTMNKGPNVDNLSELGQECYKNCQENHFKKFHSSTNFIKFQNEFLKVNEQIQPEEFIANFESDMAYLCGSAIILWQQFQSVVLHSDKIVQHLAKVHHMHRIKRFSEGFFSIEKPRLQIHSICDNNTSIFNEISELLRKSAYFNQLPPCDVECVTLDGDANSLPIIFEEKYETQIQESNSNLGLRSSRSEISLDEAFYESLLMQEAATSTIRRNMREKILNNLSKLNLRHHARAGMKEEYSPMIRRASANNFIGNKFDLTPSTISTKESVTLLKVRRFDGHSNFIGKEVSLDKKRIYQGSRSNPNNQIKSNPNNQMKSNLNSIPSQANVSPSYSMHNLELSDENKLSNSESLPDLTINRKKSIVNQLKQQIPSLRKIISQETNDNSTSFKSESISSISSTTSTTASSILSSFKKEKSFESLIMIKKHFSKSNPDKNRIEPPAQFCSDNQDDEKNEQQMNNIKDGDKKNDFKGPKTESIVEETIENLAVDDEGDKTPTGNDSINSEDDDESTPKSNKMTNEKLTLLEMIKSNECLVCGSQDNTCQCNDHEDDDYYHDVLPSIRRASAVGSDLISFVKAKEDFRQQISSKSASRGWLIYSDFSCLASRIPYFQFDGDVRSFGNEGVHLIVCVHGLDGNSADLRLVKTYLELGLPTANFEFLMSQRNQGETFDSFESLTDRLVQEITHHIDVYNLNPSKISFIGHSLGNIIIRAALARPEMKSWLTKLHTFLSLSGPHLGTAYNNSGLVNMGLWFMQKWKKSGSLLQLAMKDSSDFRQTFLYRLSLESGLEHFKHILLCGSSQDHYVPIHSAHIELCSSALNDASSNGIAYREMVSNLLHPIMSKPSIKLIRYDVHHSLGSNANALIGRAAHIAVLDSELFIEKFMVVTGLKYFT